MTDAVATTIGPAKAAGRPRDGNVTRNVGTPQGTVAGNTCPPRGEDQSNRDESSEGGARKRAANVHHGACTCKGHVPGGKCGAARKRRVGRGPTGETGNLYGEQHQIGSRRPGSARLRVGGWSRRASAGLEEWSLRRRRASGPLRQNPAYRWPLHDLPSAAWRLPMTRPARGGPAARRLPPARTLTKIRVRADARQPRVPVRVRQFTLRADA